MDVVLLTLTVFSLAAAGGFGAVTWYTLRDARQRSRARVASLAAALDGDDQPALAGSRVPLQRGGQAGALFDMERRSAAQGRPLIKLAVGFAMAVLLIVAIAMVGAGHDAPAPRSVATDSSASAPSLELLSMRHEQAADTLTVTGLVRNPGAAPASAVTAVVFAFDRAGNFLASGRAPLEFGRLDAGDESPFRVTIANVSDVGRYRVSFRTDAGVVRHVDRRTGSGQLASAVDR
jgi:hypothetical protein